MSFIDWFHLCEHTQPLPSVFTICRKQATTKSNGCKHFTWSWVTCFCYLLELPLSLVITSCTMSLALSTAWMEASDSCVVCVCVCVCVCACACVCMCVCVQKKKWMHMCVRYIVHVYITNIHVHVQSTNHISLLKHRDRYYIVHKVAHAEVPYSRELVKKKHFLGRKLSQIARFCQAKGWCHTPKFHREKFHK